MCCDSNRPQKHSCSCQDIYLNNPELWSKKKKIKMLEDYVICMEKQIIEIKETIEELKK